MVTHFWLRKPCREGAPAETARAMASCDQLRRSIWFGRYFDSVSFSAFHHRHQRELEKRRRMHRSRAPRSNRLRKPSIGSNRGSALKNSLKVAPRGSRPVLSAPCLGPQLTAATKRFEADTVENIVDQTESTEDTQTVRIPNRPNRAPPCRVVGEGAGWGGLGGMSAPGVGRAAARLRLAFIELSA